MSPDTTESALLEWLKSRTEQELARVLSNRLDVLEPPWPRRLDDLAQSLSDHESTLVATYHIPLPANQVLAMLQLAEGISLESNTEISRLVSLLEDADEDGVRDIIIGMLQPWALAWIGPDGRVFINEQLRGSTLRHFGLGRHYATVLPGLKMEELNRIAVALGVRGGTRKQDFIDRLTRWFADAENITALLRDAPDEARELLVDVAWNGPERHYTVDILHRDRRRAGADQSGVAWAMDRGLLIPYQGMFGVAEMPLEISLAIRGDDFKFGFTPEPPVLTSVPVEPELVAAESAAAALRMLDRVTSVLDGASTEPIPLLKNGTVGVRSIKTLAKGLGATADEIRLAVDLANALELLTPTVDEPEESAPRRRGRGKGRRYQDEPQVIGIAPADDYPAWRSMPSSQRLCSLISTWFDLPAASLVDQKVVKEVLDGEPSTGYAHVRSIVMEQAAALPGGFTDPAQLPDSVRWHAPLLADPLVETMTDAAVREATLLGALASGAITPLGSALLRDQSADSADLMKAAESLVAAARTTALFGTDLTAVVTGSADTELAGLLDRAADRESQSSAMTWRFTPASVRRAFDNGATLETLISDLSSVSTSGQLPQPLTYLINDVSRRHGEASVISASSVIVTATESLAAELAAQRKLAKLELHQVAQTVLVTSSDQATTLSALRQAGYSPIETSPDGTPVLALSASSTPSVDDHGQADVTLEIYDDVPDIAAIAIHAQRPDPARHAARLLNEPDAPARRNDAGSPTLGAHLRERMTGRMSREWMQLTVHLDYGAHARISYREDDGTSTAMRISATDWYDDVVEAWCWDTHEYRDLEIDRIQPVAFS